MEQQERLSLRLAETEPKKSERRSDSKKHFEHLDAAFENSPSPKSEPAKIVSSVIMKERTGNKVVNVCLAKQATVSFLCWLGKNLA